MLSYHHAQFIINESLKKWYNHIYFKHDKAFFSHRRKGTGVNNKMTDGSMRLSFFSFRVLAVKKAHNTYN